MSLDSKLRQADRLLASLLRSTESALVKAYADSLKLIRSELAQVYARYDDMSYAEMQKYNRLSALEGRIREELLLLTGKKARILLSALGDMYAESYYFAAYALESEVQAKLAYRLLNPRVIEASVQNQISGLTLNERLRKHRADVIYSIRQEITQGLIHGESYRDMAKRVKGALENDASKAIRVVRTEAHRVQQAGRLDSLQHATSKGVHLVKVWVATLDNRTRDTHQDMDGQKKEIDEDFVSPSGAHGPAPGQLGSAAEDINCRCSLRAEITGYEPEVRRARGEGTIPYTTYNEWKTSRL